MFIQTETTPNPLTLKFLPGVEVLSSGTASFTDKSSVSASPLAEALFAIKDMEGVFFGADFISITKSENGSWDILKPSILTTIMEHFVAGKPVINEVVGKDNISKSSTVSDDDSDIIKEIKELIDTRVRPAVAEDGGDIVFHGFENGVVKLEMHGACAGCPSSTVTLKDGIENMLKHYIPEVEAVEAINQPNNEAFDL